MRKTIITLAIAILAAAVTATGALAHHEPVAVAAGMAKAVADGATEAPAKMLPGKAKKEAAKAKRIERAEERLAAAKAAEQKARERVAKREQALAELTK